MVITLMLLISSLAPFQTTADLFCDNVKFLSATLPNKVSSSPVHFATATIGNSPDIVYAFAFCRGDVLNDTACAECLTNTFSLVKNATPPDMQCFSVVSYYGECMLFYNSNNILSLSYINTSEGDIGGDPPFQRWAVKNDVRLIGGVLIQELLVKTVEEAASTTPRRFATAVMDSGRDFPKVYAMAQCTPDLSTGDCLACLTHLLGTVNFTMYLRIGGQMGAIRCFFRYDSYLFYQGEPTLHLETSLGTSPAGPAPPPTPTEHKRRMVKAWTIPVAVVVPVAAAAFMCCIIYSHRIIQQRKRKVIRLQRSIPSQDLDGDEQLVWQEKNSEFLVFDLKQLLEATNNFSEENKLGQGGFGAVYKAKFPGGVDIAVKRLASHSGQGFIEFKNEVQLIAKLQHMNLVRLLGCCSQEGEKVLVYEYLQNKSLDFFIFDENRRRLLDFSKIVAIIEGIADGLLYLHKHSRLRVIHRDLKPSNILLDSEMKPKISDFGLAKICISNNTEGNTTRRVVGTYGYMAPEYASEGVFSIKSDVFSFGVIIFEILTGKRNSRSQHCGDFINLLGYAWQLWEERRWIDLVDASLVPSSQSIKVMCYINIALLCVQENAADRPSMTDVVAMLSNEKMIMSRPKQPAYFNLRVGNEEHSVAIETCSINNMTSSGIIPR